MSLPTPAVAARYCYEKVRWEEHVRRVVAEEESLQARWRQQELQRTRAQSRPRSRRAAVLTCVLGQIGGSVRQIFYIHTISTLIKCSAESKMSNVNLSMQCAVINVHQDMGHNLHEQLNVEYGGITPSK